MGTIYKYSFSEIGKTVEIEMPEGSEILSVGHQPGAAFVVWAMVTPGLPTVKRRFVVYGTGWDFDGGRALKFLGRVDLKNQGLGLVWHVFEDMRKGDS